MPETLYNNIELPEVWPPRDIDPVDFQPMRVPYLNRPFKINFAMPRGDFYSFWAGKDAKGASGGYVAAGGPAYSSNRDL